MYVTLHDPLKFKNLFESKFDLADTQEGRIFQNTIGSQFIPSTLFTIDMRAIFKC